LGWYPDIKPPCAPYSEYLLGIPLKRFLEGPNKGTTSFPMTVITAMSPPNFRWVVASHIVTLIRELNSSNV